MREVGDCASATVHSRPSQLPGRLGVQKSSGAGLRMDSPQSSGLSSAGALSGNGRGSVCNKAQCTTSKVRQPLSRSTGMESGRLLVPVGRSGGSSLPSHQAHPGGASEDPNFLCQSVSGRSSVAKPGLVSRSHGAIVQSSAQPSSLAKTAPSACRRSVSRQPAAAIPSRVAALREKIRQGGFSERVAHYSAAPQRQSSLSLYESHWRVFSSWCAERDTDPACASVPLLADFLVHLHEVRGLSAKTIANYRTSLASVLGSVEGTPVSMHPVLSSLIKSFKKMIPASRPRVPDWDLSRVLAHLRSPAYEPPRWGSTEDRMCCTRKTVFLLALAKTDRRSELQALSRDPRDLVFSPRGMSMRPVSDFVPKTGVPGMDPQPFLVPALAPFSGRDSDDRLLCPVRMVRKYLEFTGGLKSCQRLFQKVKGQGPPNAQTVSHWITDCIRAAHADAPGLKVSAHEVRRMGASWAFHAGSHSLDEILAAGSWASHTTFSSYYLASVCLQPDGRRRMQPIVAGKQLVHI